MSPQQDIIKALYDNYYEIDVTPDTLVSSHWKEFHKNVKVRVEDGQVKDIQGYGFGDLEYNSLVTRIFNWATIICYLCVLKDRGPIIKLIKTADRLVKKMGLTFTYDCFRQVCAAHLILKNLPQRSKPLRVICIGDGYGFLSALIKEMVPDAQIYLVDLGKTLFFQAYGHLKVYPDKERCLVSGQTFDQERMRHLDFIYCPAENLNSLENCVFDLAINIASMQEMNKETIKRYFTFLRQHMNTENLFYCCNREEKLMPGGEIARILDFPWKIEDRHFIDELCPWYRFILAFRQTKNGPRLFNVRIPFINYFDGDIRHRLSVLAVEREMSGVE